MVSSHLKKIQNIPIYIHMLFFLAAMLNFSVPFILETNAQYNELIESFQRVIGELEDYETLPTVDLVDWFNAQYEDLAINVQLVEVPEGVGIQLNGVMLQQVADRNSVSTYSLLSEVLVQVTQLQIVHLVVDLIKGVLYVAFISLALIIAVQYLSRKAIKFKAAFKYVTLPAVIGSLVVLGLNVSVSLSTNGIFVMSFVVTSILFSLLCLKDLKRAMTGDYLGEGRIDYDVY